MSMYKGFFRFGGVEVINVARTMAYIKAGLGAPGVVYDTPVACDGLADALGETYRTPVLDGAPWYDEARPATHGFAGVLPLTMTGLVGTTRSAEVVENIGEGGVAQKARAASRTIYTSALLVADSSEALDAGLLWLDGVLHRTCDPEAVPHVGAALEGFRVLPGPLGNQEDLDAALVDTPIDVGDPGWAGYGGSYHGDSGIFSVEAQAVDTTLVGGIDGGAPFTTDPDAIDGGGPSGGGSGPDTDGNTGGTTQDGGGAEPSYFDGGIDGGDPDTELDDVTSGGVPGETSPEPYARLVAPAELTCLSRVEVTWTFTPIDGAPVFVQIGATDHLGVELYRQAPQLITDDATEVTWVWEHASWGEWQPAVWVGSPGVGVTVSVARRPYLDPDACLAPLRRTYHQLTCVDGPTEVATWADDCDNKMMQVEWTWVGAPHRTGEPMDLITGLPLGTSVAPTANAPGVSVSTRTLPTSASLRCLAPPSPVSCGIDPDYPGFIAPPAAPVVPDPGYVEYDNVQRRVITVDPAVVPDNSTLALRWTFYTGDPDFAPVRNIRVRLWRQLDPDFATHVECEFESEFWVTFVPDNGAVVVDGISGDVTAVCEDGSTSQANQLVRGAYRGAFDFPTMGCLGRYFIAIDSSQGYDFLGVSIEAAPREY